MKANNGLVNVLCLKASDQTANFEKMICIFAVESRLMGYKTEVPSLYDLVVVWSLDFKTNI